MKPTMTEKEKTRLQKYLKLTSEEKKKYLIDNLGKDGINRTFFHSIGFIMNKTKQKDIYKVYKENKIGKNEQIGLKSLDEMLEYIISINFCPDICYSELQPTGFKFVTLKDTPCAPNKQGVEIRNDVKMQIK